MRGIIFTVIALCAVIAAACTQQGRSVEMRDTEREVWSTVEEFYYDNVDTLSRRDISIVVRYGCGYVSDSVAMSILSVSPDSLVLEEPFTLRIPRLGDMRPAEHTFLYRRNVLLGRISHVALPSVLRILLREFPHVLVPVGLGEN